MARASRKTAQPVAAQPEAAVTQPVVAQPAAPVVPAAEAEVVLSKAELTIAEQLAAAVVSNQKAGRSMLAAVAAGRAARVTGEHAKLIVSTMVALVAAGGGDPVSDATQAQYRTAVKALLDASDKEFAAAIKDTSSMFAAYKALGTLRRADNGDAGTGRPPRQPVADSAAPEAPAAAPVKAGKADGAARPAAELLADMARLLGELKGRTDNRVALATLATIVDDLETIAGLFKD